MRTLARPFLLSVVVLLTPACSPAPVGQDTMGGRGGALSAGGVGGSSTPMAGTGGSAAPLAGTSGMPATGGTAAGCAVTTAPDDQIADFELGLAKLLEVGGRVGSWYLYNDGTAGGTQTPAKEVNKPLAAEGPGACASLFALHTTGTGFASWAGVAANLAPKTTAGTKGPFDASKYSGIAFRAKAARSVLVRVGFADKNSDPDGGVCKDTIDKTDKSRCTDHFGKDLPVAAEWKDYAVPFAGLTQKGFGYVATALDRANLYSLFFQARAEPGAPLSYDLWIDDVRFTR